MKELREMVDYFDFAEIRRVALLNDLESPYCSDRRHCDIDIMLIENAQTRRIKSIMQKYGIVDFDEMIKILRSGEDAKNRIIKILHLRGFSNVA